MPAASSSRASSSTPSSHYKSFRPSKTGPSAPTPPSWTLDEHVLHLTALLNAHPAAEELQSTWEGYATAPMGQGSRPLALGLKDYKAALDSGRRISGNNGKNDSRQGTSLNRSGLPLWVVVRMLKASWHAEGSWPLIGADASEKETQLSILPSNPQRSTGTSVATSTPHPPPSTTTTTMKIPRSVHPTALLLKGKAPLVTTMTPEPGPPARPDPSPDEVAQAYRARGILVPDPSVLIPSDDEGEEAPTGGEAIDDDSA